MSCALLSNVNVESIARRLERHRVHVPSGYGAWRQEIGDPQSGTWQSLPSTVFLLVDGAELLRDASVEAGFAEIDESAAWMSRAAERWPATKIVVSTIDVPASLPQPLKNTLLERRFEQHWLGAISAASAAHPNVHVFDLKALVEQTGRAQFYSSKRWYLGGLRFSVVGEKLIARELERILDAQSVPRKKCLLLDLDDTLWGGVLGEEGIEGIQLSATGEGARYRDFQRGIRKLRELGVILGAVSRNDPREVAEVLERHPHMVLRSEDFAILKIDWSPKPERIAQVARDLDIGIDSIVFVDDNPVERAAVRAALPEVAVPEFPADTCELPAFLLQLHKDYFFTLESTAEDRKRTESYLANARRAVERTSAASLDEFLSRLGTRIEIGALADGDIARAAQLTQKTNQFNLTTRRYTEQQLQALRATPGVTVDIASVADKYGDNGKVFLGIVRKLETDAAELDTFLLSCRVMGRFVEDQLLDYVVRRLRAEGVRTLRVPFVVTNRNAPAREFVERLAGGRVVSTDANGGATLEFDIANGSPVTKPAYAELCTR